MEFWCHICKREVEVTPSFECTSCHKFFIEEIENPDQHPRNFIPYGANSRSRMVTELIFMPSIRPSRYLAGQNDHDQSLDALISQLMLNDPNRYGPPPANKEAVSLLKTVTVTQELIKKRGALHKGVDEFGHKIDNERLSIECAVCKDEFSPGDEALDMPCLHIFHKDCITAWLESHNNCPVCRFELPTDDPDYEARRLRK